MHKPLKVPNTIRINNFDVDIKVQDSEYGDASRKFGEFDANSLVIWFDGGKPKQQQLDTLFHEICHAIYWFYHIDDTDREERVVSQMTSGWLQVFRDNPWLLDLPKKVYHG